jgi:hypothetical protein
MQELFHLAFGKMVSAEMVLAQPAQLNAKPIQSGLNACPMKYLPYRIWNLFNWGEAQKGQVEVVLPDSSLFNHLTI